MERYLQVNLLGPGPRLMKKRIYRAAVSQRLRNSGLEGTIPETSYVSITGPLHCLDIQYEYKHKTLTSVIRCYVLRF